MIPQLSVMLCAMRKEVILAITIGLLLGLIITFGIYTANQATSKTDSVSDNQLLPTPGTTNVTDSQALITLVSPLDGEIFKVAEATISGKVKPGTQLIILSESEDLVVTIDKDNSFNQTVKLASGANLIELIAINGTDRQDIKINLVYTTANYE